MGNNWQIIALFLLSLTCIAFPITLHSPSDSLLASQPAQTFTWSAQQASCDLLINGTPALTTITPAINTIELYEDFNSTSLPSEWEAYEFDGTNISFNGTHATIAAHQGTNHDIWNSTRINLRNAPRIMRNFSAQDATFEVKIDGEPLSLENRHTYGLHLWQDNDNFLRFEFRHQTQTAAESYAVLNGNGTLPALIDSGSIAMGGSNYLKVTRLGNTFTLDYWVNQSDSWHQAGQFELENFTINKVGLHAINAGENPETVAHMDYFRASYEEQGNFSASLNLSDGIYLWSASCNNSTSENRTLSIDTQPPVLLIESPANNSTHASPAIDFNFTATDANPDSCWYSLDNSSSIPLPSCNSTQLSNLTEGSHTLTLFANDTLNQSSNLTHSFAMQFPKQQPAATFVFVPSTGGGGGGGQTYIPPPQKPQEETPQNEETAAPSEGTQGASLSEKQPGKDEPQAPAAGKTGGTPSPEQIILPEPQEGSQQIPSLSADGPQPLLSASLLDESLFLPLLLACAPAAAIGLLFIALLLAKKCRACKAYSLITARRCRKCFEPFSSHLPATPEQHMLELHHL